MKTTIHKVPTFYIMQFSNVLAKQGVCLSECFRDLGADISSYTSLQSSIDGAFFSRLITHIVKQKGILSPGILLGAALQPIHHGSFGLAIMNCNTGVDIIKLVQRYIEVLIPGISLTIAENDDVITVNVVDSYWRDETHCFFIDVLTAAFINLHRTILQSGNARIITSLLFDYEKHEDEISQRITTEYDCKYNQAICGVLINAKNAVLPLTGSDPVSFEYAVQLCEKERERVCTDTLTNKLKLHFECAKERIPTLEEAANALGVSKRTLHRQLGAEGTSFKQERDSFLKHRAYELLHVKQLSVQQTADKLGYADPSNFRRAFTKWYGAPPSSIQKHSAVTK